MTGQEILQRRALARLGPKMRARLREAGIKEVVVAGGAMLRKAKDVDLYVLEPDKNILEGLFDKNPRRAMTLRLDRRDYQLCRYYHPTLMALVESFDFAHCQVGALVPTNDHAHWTQVNVAYTPAYTDAMAAGTTWYVGSAYPLASLCRVPRAAEKLGLGRAETSALTLTTLKAVLERGIADPDDLRDQLEGVDLGISTEDLGINWDMLEGLGALLRPPAAPAVKVTPASPTSNPFDLFGS